MAYAQHTDVEARLGRELDESEQTIVEVRLEDAERLIRSQVKDLDDLIDGDELDVDLVIQIESEAVLRLIRNPEGFLTETDGNYTYSLAQQVASGRLEILDSEWSLLGVTRGFFVIAPKMSIPWHEADSYTHDPVLPVWA